MSCSFLQALVIYFRAQNWKRYVFNFKSEDEKIFLSSIFLASILVSSGLSSTYLKQRFSFLFSQKYISGQEVLFSLLYEVESDLLVHFISHQFIYFLEKRRFFFVFSPKQKWKNGKSHFVCRRKHKLVCNVYTFAYKVCEKKSSLKKYDCMNVSLERYQSMGRSGICIYTRFWVHVLASACFAKKL